MRTNLLLLSFTALAACSDKDTGGQETGDTQPQETDTEDTDTGEAPAVWTEQRIETNLTLTGLYVTPTDDVIVVSQEGKAWYRSGDTWAAMTIDTDGEDLNDLWGSGTDASLALAAVGNAGMTGAYSGGTWTVADIGTASLLAVDGPSATDLIAVGWGGVFSNASGTFEYSDVATGRRLNDIWYDGSSAMAVGEDGDFAVLANDNWADDTLDSGRTLYGVHGLAADDIWTVGEEGSVYHWDGSQWHAVEAPADVSLWDVYEVSPTEVYVVGNNGGAWVYDGSAWTTLPTGVSNNLYGVNGADTGSIWAIGNRGMAIHLTGAE